MELTQPSLFEQEQLTEPYPPPTNQEVMDPIRGISYINDYINENQHQWLIHEIDKDEKKWLPDLKRRVQHYGYKYDYKARRVNHDMYIGELPEWLKRLSNKLHDEGHLPHIADQVIINEYKPGQGISGHIDCEPCFKGPIASLSLGSGYIMDFTNKNDKTQKIQVWLAPSSLVVLCDDARDKWLHGIAPRKSDLWEGKRYGRKRRVSLTFRKVIIK